MKRFKKLLITLTVILVTVSIGLFIYITFIHDENSLSINEKEWIQSNRSNLINFNVPNNINVFGYNGSGVFFDYIDKLNDFAEINIHKNVIVLTEQRNNQLGFIVTEEFLGNSRLLYQDHYVLVAHTEKVVSRYIDL
jgi:uncharacterized protein YxeA